MSRFRLLNLVGLLLCGGLLAGAAWLQLVLELEPCPLCILQRVVVLVLALFFLLALLQNPRWWGRRVYAGVGVIISAVGIAIAGRHVWLQHLPPDQVPECGPGLSFMLEVFPLGEALGMIFRGSGECAEVAWRFVGLSIPEWTLVVFVGYLLGCLLVLRYPGKT